jgi:hypothetical protein
MQSSGQPAILTPKYCGARKWAWKWLLIAVRQSEQRGLGEPPLFPCVPVLSELTYHQELFFYSTVRFSSKRERFSIHPNPVSPKKIRNQAREPDSSVFHIGITMPDLLPGTRHVGARLPNSINAYRAEGTSTAWTSSE